MIFSYLVVASDPEVEPGPRSLGRVVALGLVAAALVAIKPAYLPWIGSFLALVYGRRIVLERFRWRAWREPLALAALTVIVLLPWMLANLRDAGTAMYPLLGSGFHASRYGTYPPVWNTLTPRVVLDIVAHESHVLAPQLVTCGLLLGLASFAAARSGGPRPGAPALFVLLSGLVLVMVIVVGTAAQDLLRYSYPGVAAALLVGSYRMAVAAGRSGASKRVMAAAVAACLVVVGGNAHGLVQYYGHAASNLALAVLGPDARPAMLAGVLARDGGAERQAVLRMQQALPAGTPFLERLDYPFLLDFRRNEVLVADWPGAAGLPPGMPVFQGPEKLAAYLQLVRIRYVAYAYASEAQFPAAERDQWQDKRWIQLEANLAYDFQGNLAALMQTRRLVFKDDARAVIDLAEPAGR
jgi:hypothetical protein